MFDAEKRLEAVRRRLGDAKAVHSGWTDGIDTRSAAEIANEMEQIIYSALCYADGVPGLYLPKQP